MADLNFCAPKLWILSQFIPVAVLLLSIQCYLMPAQKPKKLECQVVIKYELVEAGFEPMTSFRVQTKKLRQQGLGFGLLLRAGIQWFEALSFSRERLPAYFL